MRLLAARAAPVSPPLPVEIGPGPMPDVLLRALDITIGGRLGGLLAGDYRSPHLGEGTELAQVRPSVPGDDVRLLDWNVTARTGEPHVRVHLAERVLVSWLVLDTSPSMRFGTAERRKSDVAEGAAIALGHVATRRGNRLGVVTFGDDEPRALPPRQGRVGLLGLLGALHGEQRSARGATSLGEALSRTGALARRDPREQELPNVGELYLVDPETGRQLRVDTRSRRLRERFAAAASADRDDVVRELASLGIRHHVLSTSGDWLRSLAVFLKRGGP